MDDTPETPEVPAVTHRTMSEVDASMVDRAMAHADAVEPDEPLEPDEPVEPDVPDPTLTPEGLDDTE